MSLEVYVFSEILNEIIPPLKGGQGDVHEDFRNF